LTTCVGLLQGREREEALEQICFGGLRSALRRDQEILADWVRGSVGALWGWSMDRRAFERLVAEALNDLPETFREKLDNIQVVVEDWPDRETMRLAGVRHPAQFLGFYHGVPQTKRTHNYGLVLPDKITIYQRPIEMRCSTAEQVRTTIRRVLRHEVAHHFGLDDARLREIGAY